MTLAVIEAGWPRFLGSTGKKHTPLIVSHTFSFPPHMGLHFRAMRWTCLENAVERKEWPCKKRGELCQDQRHAPSKQSLVSWISLWNILWSLIPAPFSAASVFVLWTFFTLLPNDMLWLARECEGPVYTKICFILKEQETHGSPAHLSSLWIGDTHSDSPRYSRWTLNPQQKLRVAFCCRLTGCVCS